MTLHPNSTLQGGKYKILKVLGQGGFGITYLAEQTMLERKVAIKEFYMKEFCERDEATSYVTLGTAGSHATVERFRQKFIKEARSIAKLEHQHIVQVLDVFEENGTAYYVMNFCGGGSLANKVSDGKYLSEPIATRYILQVADALAYIHQRKMNHLDIKPGNVMLNEKDNIMLIDFGLSKQYDEGGQQTSTTPVGISEGYAPMEQYKQGGVKEFSPETDIYALGATFFKLLTGKTPPGASDVNEDGLPIDELEKNGVSQAAIDVITKAMEPRRKQRLHNVKDIIDVLYVRQVKKEQTYYKQKPLGKITEEDEETVQIESGIRTGKKVEKETDVSDNVVYPQGFVASWKHFFLNIASFKGYSNWSNYLSVVLPWLVCWCPSLIFRFLWEYTPGGFFWYYLGLDPLLVDIINVICFSFPLITLEYRKIRDEGLSPSGSSLMVLLIQMPLLVVIPGCIFNLKTRIFLMWYIVLLIKIPLLACLLNKNKSTLKCVWNYTICAILFIVAMYMTIKYYA